jgi:hypothetical protein
MKKIIFIIALLFSLPIFSQTPIDKILGEAKYLVNEGEYNQAIKLLEEKKNIAGDNPRALYYLIKARYALIEANIDDYDYTIVEELRENIYKFSNLDKAKKKKIPADIEAEVADINEKLNKFPSKEEYITQRQKKIANKQLKDIADAYKRSYYNEVLRLIELYKLSDIPIYELGYYRAMAAYKLLQPETAEFKQIDDVRTLLNVYLEHYSHKNIAYDNNIKEALTILNKYPTTEAELLQKREDAKREEELYKKATSLFGKWYTSWEDIVNARNATTEYLLLGVINRSHYKEIERNSEELNTYPETEEAYNKEKNDEKRRTIEAKKKADREKRREDRKDYWGKFASLGYEGGTIAHGLRFECGGSRSLVGFFVNARSSFKGKDELTNFIGSNDFPENKTEFIGGLNFRIFQWAYLNIGAGVGTHYYPFMNDYRREATVKDKTYIAGYEGITFRIGKRFNLLGGLSFIDVTKKFYTPEFTFGFTINLL